MAFDLHIVGDPDQAAACSVDHLVFGTGLLIGVAGKSRAAELL
jgi:hypothetical protein